MLRVWALLAALLLTGCVKSRGFPCQTSAQCGPEGVCEPVGFCSFVDPACNGGRRFGQHSADYSNLCIGDAGDGGQTNVEAGQVDDAGNLIDAFIVDSGPTVDAGPLSCIDELAVGGYHACVRKGGNVECWGSSDQGQIGDGKLIRRSTPRPVLALSNAAQLSLGALHSCARTTAGRVMCWGGNNAKQQARMDTDEVVTTPAEIPGLTNIIQVATGFYFSCALDMAGDVWCWGDNGNAQLGQPGTTFVNPVKVPGLPAGGARAIVTGRDHGCAIVKTPADTVYCWGQNGGGALGDGTTMPRSGAVLSMATNVDRMVAGQNHNCALRRDGSVICWGEGYAGQLARGSQAASATPLTISQVSGVVELAAGWDSQCAKLSGGTWMCWGNDSWGKLGDGSGTYNQTMPGPNMATGAIQVGLGEVSGCARFADKVQCWGANFFGQVGDGSAITSPVPIKAQPINVAQVSAGRSHTCIRDNGDQAVCWGWNQERQLGHSGNTSVIEVPMTVVGLTGVLQVSAGAQTSCARVATGALCWGSNTNHMLGNNETPPLARDVPTPVFGLGVISDLEQSPSHVCASLSANGELVCWGDNMFLQIDSTPGLKPAPVTTGLTAVTDFSVGDDFTCAVVGGEVRCRGENSSGELGQGDFAVKSGWVTVQKTAGPLTGVLEVASGYAHSCARTATEVYCWGIGYAGQIGDGGGVPRNRATLVSGLTAIQLALGGLTSCALTSAGGVHCWGDNFFGNVGDGTYDTVIRPVQVVSLGTGVQQISVNRSHACARKSDGQLYCWGSSENGELGNLPAILVRNPVDARLSCP